MTNNIYKGKGNASKMSFEKEIKAMIQMKCYD